MRGEVHLYCEDSAMNFIRRSLHRVLPMPADVSECQGFADVMESSSDFALGKVSLPLFINMDGTNKSGLGYDGLCVS